MLLDQQQKSKYLEIEDIEAYLHNETLKKEQREVYAHSVKIREKLKKNILNQFCLKPTNWDLKELIESKSRKQTLFTRIDNLYRQYVTGNSEDEIELSTRILQFYRPELTERQHTENMGKILLISY